MFTGCGKSDSSKLVGRWAIEDGQQTRVFIEDVELLKDGAGIVGGMGVTWKTENGRIYFTSTVEAIAFACDYKISGSTLTLTNDAQRSITLKKHQGNISNNNTLPAGYAELTFFDFAAGTSDAVPNGIVKFDGQKVIVKGYMYPQKNHTEIEKFALVEKFTPNLFAGTTPHPTDMIVVEIKTGQKIDYRSKPIYIGGTLRVRRDYDYGNLPYTIEADFVR
jgi:hypothetical protein